MSVYKHNILSNILRMKQIQRQANVLKSNQIYFKKNLSIMIFKSIIQDAVHSYIFHSILH